MLDSETKKKIDDLRDILAGKTPGPESQVEQITTALIYKFMHDMDEESVEMGGKRSFFVGKYKKYAWKNLFDTKLEGEGKVNLYREAIENMYNNPGAPGLFREIFKNADLPFRDARTLNMFLKGINEFEYSHSEKLGDAFEYLLSFMGSQGDAGQFRTPRHIIDFIVEIVDPQKNEKILDPACGTAGFLISSFKHIQKRNTNKKANGKLTAVDRKRIGKNLAGYDISPDMTRLSLVNMYLHQFPTPKIHEYDTLSSEDRWNEYYDVILANPPFFSPKGGIQPHSRFGVRSKRAEVLFVDYIMGHLKPKGRAGVIVPEGIIFKTDKAYKAMRKKLVEDCLVGVISLPAGVFQPYSGVKTSILILDKDLHQKSDSIFFAKVENDGFSLGAQRTPIDKNDLPKVLKSIQSRDADNFDFIEVNKSKIMERDDASLSVVNYLNHEISISNFETVKVTDYARFQRGTSVTKKDVEDGNIPVIAGGQKPAYFHNQGNREANSITISSSGAYAGFVSFHPYPIFASDCFTVISKSQNLNQKFLFYLLKSRQEEIYDMQSGGAQPHVYIRDFSDFEIPLPAIEIQQKIVEELDGYQKIIDGCRQIVENYRPAIDIDPSWEIVELGNIVNSKPVYGSGAKKVPFDGKVRYIRITDITDDGRLKDAEPVSPSRVEKEYFLNENDFLIARSASVGRSYLHLANDIKCQFAGYLIKFPLDRRKIVPQYLFYLTKLGKYLTWINQRKKQGTISNINAQEYLSFSFPLPSVAVQKEIVKELDEHQKIVDSTKKLIEIHTQRIQERISEVWGK